MFKRKAAGENLRLFLFLRMSLSDNQRPLFRDML